MDTGNTGFIMIGAALVFIMTPGLAFFYGGLVRRKNVVNTMMACVAIMGLSVFMWTLFGYSLSFGSDHGGVIGSLEWLGLNGVGWDAGPYSDSIPHLVYCAFQMMFAMITPALITGAVVGRMKFKALFAFIALWSVIVYYPMAHMVWGQGGFLASIGSVDFAGGNVVHISSGVAEDAAMRRLLTAFTIFLSLFSEPLFCGLDGTGSTQEAHSRQTDLQHMHL